VELTCSFANRMVVRESETLLIFPFVSNNTRLISDFLIILLSRITSYNVPFACAPAHIQLVACLFQRFGRPQAPRAVGSSAVTVGRA
jgi:hypothetical protein